MSNYEETISSRGINRFFSRDNIILVYVILVVITILIVITAILAFYLNIKNEDKLLNNIYIKNVDVSGLTKQEAISKVEEDIHKKMNNHIILKYNNYQFYVEPEQFDANFDVVSAVDYAYGIGKEKRCFWKYNRLH